VGVDEVAILEVHLEDEEPPIRLGEVLSGKLL